MNDKILYTVFCEPHRYNSFASLLKPDVIFDDFDPEPYRKPYRFLTYLNNLKITKVVMCGFLPRWLYHHGHNILKILAYFDYKSYLIDNDPFEDNPESHHLRVILNDVVCRFSADPIFNRPLDREFHIKNVGYIPLPQDYRQPRKEQGTKKIIICSNLRIRAMFPEAEAAIRKFGDRLIPGFGQWFIDRRKEIFDSDDSLDSKFERATADYLLFIAVNERMKILTVSSIVDKSRLEIYGNDEWGRFFPENYKGWLRPSDFEQKLNEPNLWIIPNLSLNPYNAFGPFYDMIRWKKLFVSPRMIDGNLGSQYSSAEELNDLLADKNLDRINGNVDILAEHYAGRIDDMVKIIKEA